MKLFLLSALLAVASFGCSQGMGKFAAISKREIPEQGLTLGAPGAILGKGEDCIHQIIAFPSKWSYDMEAIVKQACPGDVIRNAKIERNYWYVPLVYGRDCLRIEGWCSK